MLFCRRLPPPGSRQCHRLEQRATLVNVKLKWAKDRALDHVVSREKHLRHVLHLVHLIASSPSHQISANTLTRPALREPAAFLRRFPAVFAQSPSSPSSFSLSPAALLARDREIETLIAAEKDLVSRLRRLLMLTDGGSLPIHTIDLLRFDLGLPLDYHHSLLPRCPDLFELFQPPGDERIWLRLRKWDPRLAVSELRRRHGDEKDPILAFPVSFPKGFGLKKKCVEWLREWQTLPYTDPYGGPPEGMDPRTDVAKKRNVAVFHELLHLTIGKKTERRNVSNMRRPLGLPQKFTKVFERHPGIFYISRKLDTHTVVLREAYSRGRELAEKHPLVEVREKYMELMRVRRGDEEGDKSENGEDDEGIYECDSLAKV